MREAQFGQQADAHRGRTFLPEDETAVGANPVLVLSHAFWARRFGSQVEQALTGERSMAALSSAFGLTALLLVCLGLYGVIAQWAALRTREIGVRVALGATAGGVRWLVMRQAFGLVLVGMAVGLPAAVAVARLLRDFLFGLSPTDPATLTSVAALLLAVAAGAAYLPARRASQLDPVRALRSE